MKLDKKTLNSFEPYNGIVIAEFACGHEGDLVKFNNLVDRVKKSEAKIIKSQIFTPIEKRKPSFHPTIQYRSFQTGNAFSRKCGCFQIGN